MKVAIVHDWLNTKFGGAENVVAELADLYPEAPIYTLLYAPELVGDRIHPGRVRPSFLQKLPRWLQRRSRYLLPLIPMAIEQFDLSAYDVVISSSSAFAKGVITRPETLHICYCHTPMRFVWDYWPGYIEEQHVGRVQRGAIHVLTSRLRLWDYYSAARVDAWIANSHTTAQRIKKYYHQAASAVIYPGADVTQFAPMAKSGNYFVTLSSLTPYKKIDLAIAACNRLEHRLVVIGDGPDRSRLERLAGPTIEFAGRVSDTERAHLLAGAEAMLFPNEEDFGIAPIEAMASGTPVIAFGRGGLTETIAPGTTGILFQPQTVEALMAAISDFRSTPFSAAALTSQAATFSTAAFRKNITKSVKEAYDAYRT